MSNIIMNELIEAEKDLAFRTEKIETDYKLYRPSTKSKFFERELLLQQKAQKKVDALKREINSLNLLTPEQIIHVCNEVLNFRLSRKNYNKEVQKQMQKKQPLIFVLQKGEERSVILEVDNRTSTDFKEPISKPMLIDNLLLDYYAIKNIVII